jgi:phosphoribosylformylglycinamidine synthase I
MFIASGKLVPTLCVGTRARTVRVPHSTGASPEPMTRPRAIVLRAPGTNCDEETAAAWERAGAAAETWHIGRLLAAPHALDAFQALTIPGGFSYGDDLGAGRIFATRLGHVLADALSRFRDRGGLVLGICNGFQVLVRAGLLPGTGGDDRVTLTHNDSGRFESRWVRMMPTPGRSPFIAGAAPIELPVAHGEGKFVTSRPGALDALHAAGQVVLRYVDATGRVTEAYPANPNGSPGGVAAVCDPTGRVFGLMPHPERFVDPTHHPRWTRRAVDNAACDGLRIFQSAVDALRS